MTGQGEGGWLAGEAEGEQEAKGESARGQRKMGSQSGEGGAPKERRGGK